MGSSIERASGRLGRSLARMLCVSAAFALQAAVAQESQAEAQLLEEVLVTAQKREQNIQDIPISVTAFGGESLEERRIYSAVQLGDITPGLIVNEFGNPTTTVFNIRGATQFDFGDHLESPVAVFVDGSYVPYLSAVGMNLFDMERVEVLRGPQGTLFGRNATGGAIQLITARPTETPEAYVDVSMGNFSAVRVESVISGPIAGEVLGRLSVVSDQHDGYYRNAIGGDKGDADNFSWRARVTAPLGESADIDLSVRGTHDDTLSSPYVSSAAYPAGPYGLAHTGDDAAHAQWCADFFFTEATPGGINCLSPDLDDGNPFTMSHNRDGRFKRDYLAATATINWTLGFGTLTSVTSFGSQEREYTSEDPDGSSLDILTFAQSADANDFSQELRLLGETDRLTWVAGLYYLDIDGDYTGSVGFYPGDPFIEAITGNAWEQETRSTAVFGQIDFDLTENWMLVTGLRWTEDEKDFGFFPGCSGVACDLFGFTDPSIVQGSGFNDSVPGADTNRKSDNWDGTLRLSWRPNDDWMWFGSISRGTKAGGYNAAPVATYSVDQTLFDDEELTSYEFGFKSTLAEGRVRVDGTVFYYDYADIQLFNQSDASVVSFNQDGTSMGGELEVNAMSAGGLEFGLGLSFLDTELDPIQYLNPLTFETVLFDDEEAVNAPNFTGNLLLRKEWPTTLGMLSLQGDVSYIGDRKLNLINHPVTRGEAYTVGNLRAGWRSDSDRWEASLFVNNVTDEEYAVVASPLLLDTGAFIQIFGPPRTYGVSLRFNY